jgi:hypothetical protein
MPITYRLRGGVVRIHRLELRQWDAKHIVVLPSDVHPHLTQAAIVLIAQADDFDTLPDGQW